MQVDLNQVGKRFNREWIFKNISASISPTSPTAILGSNGSGKSTLLRIISGFLSPSAGELSYTANDSVIPRDQLYKHVTIAAPYTSVFEELTLKEMIEFQQKFSSYRGSLETAEIPELLQLGAQKNKQIKFFSSGMKQRVKLGLAILANSSLLLLDEPTSNLDAKGIAWYMQLMDSQTKDRCVVVCSNSMKDEYAFCTSEIQVDAFKVT